ncbi:MAG TPA: cation:proton antiporter [Thermomicrobiales bacterium]|nr:cation:proton antiporter [Thermomicrobiales bacterium]
MPDLLTAFGLIAVVLLVAGAASGVVERTLLSFPMLFLALGAALGPRGVGLLRVGPRDPALEALAVLSLALVLFLDAVRLRFDGGRRAWLAPALALGPGTVLVVAIVAGAAALLLGLGWLPALLLGAVLASTDPVVLRDVVRDERVPAAVRRALTLEAGMNDLVVLPVLLVLAAVARADVGGAAAWALFLLRLFVFGPAAGYAIGGAGSWLIAAVDRRMGIRREYQALYGLGLVLAAYVAGTAAGGSGFLAAFAAGIAVVTLNNELCDCFLEYGETTAEMAMLLTFILFGALLSTLFDALPLAATLALAAIVIVVARPLALNLVLLRAVVSWRARVFIGWFGPRGLSSLLFALLLVQDDVPQAGRLLAIAGLVVAVSVVVHGMSATPLSAWYGRAVTRKTLAEERESGPGGLFAPPAADVPRVSVAELAAHLAGPDPPIVLDVRSRSAYAADATRIPGSVRVAPDHLDEWARQHPPGRPVVTYCT